MPKKTALIADDGPSLSRILRFKTALLAAQAETSPDGILVVDPEGAIVSYNSRFARMWSIPEDVLESRSDRRAIESVLDQLMEPERFLERVGHLYAHPDQESTDELALRDGRFFERYSAPIFGEAGECFGRVWYFRDVTDRKKAADVELAREKVRLQKQLVAHVSHELRTPITVIRSASQTLRLWHPHPDKKTVNLVDLIERNTQRLANMVEQLLALSALEDAGSRPRRESLDLGVFLADFRTLIAPLAEARKVSLRLDVPAQVVVRADPVQMESVFQNLCDNAIAYSRKGGSVVVAARADEDRAEVSVRDDGMGIAESDLPRIFDRLYRSKAAGAVRPKGLGLGLSIVKGIVEAHGGRIWAESSTGEGTVFRFTLPLAA